VKPLKILISILILVVIFIFIIAALLPSHFRIERSVRIEKPVDDTFYFIVDLTQRPRWDPWLEKDPKARSEIGGSRQGIGAVWRWEGETLGKGRLEIQDAKENEYIQNVLIFESPRPDTAAVIWKFRADGAGTEVTWIMEGRLGFPVGRLKGLFMNRFIGSDFDKGLANLKRELESGR